MLIKVVGYDYFIQKSASTVNYYSTLPRFITSPESVQSSCVRWHTSSRFKVVVCASTPRMYPRSGYFLVTYIVTQLLIMLIILKSKLRVAPYLFTLDKRMKSPFQTRLRHFLRLKLGLCCFLAQPSFQAAVESTLAMFQAMSNVCQVKEFYLRPLST